METTENQSTNTHKEVDLKRPSIFKRLRRSFTLVFRRKNIRKRTKSESNIPEKMEVVPNVENAKRGSLIDEPATKLTDEQIDANESMETKFRPPTKVPLFLNEFTSELKQSLQLRSKQIEEGDKSPTEAIKQIENLRTLSSIVDEDKNDVKIEIETKTFEEKLAMFESQISSGTVSVNNDTLMKQQRTQSEIIDPENVDIRLKELANDQEHLDKRRSGCDRVDELVYPEGKNTEIMENEIKEDSKIEEKVEEKAKESEERKVLTAECDNTVEEDNRTSRADGVCKFDTDTATVDDNDAVRECPAKEKDEDIVEVVKAASDAIVEVLEESSTTKGSEESRSSGEEETNEKIATNVAEESQTGSDRSSGSTTTNQTSDNDSSMSRPAQDEKSTTDTATLQMQ